MKLSTSWLNNFLSLDDLKVEDLAQKLTMGAFEVEDLKRTGPKLKGPIVVGKILKIQKHPNADRLSVTSVTTDGKNELVIVCGAKNIQVGQKVPVCLNGAIVVNRQDGSELAIKTSKIREVESFGMLCSPGELGIKTEDQNGILILPDEAQLGQNVIDYLSLEGDTVLEVASRSNRGDALSVFGLSKEISALARKKLKEITFKEPDFDNSVQGISPKIEDTKDTYVFYTATIENITVCESPNWLKKLLESVQIRSINNIVDITNYINFSSDQPLHAYDREKLHGKHLTSRLAKNSEKVTTIDGKTRELKEGILVISDEKEPVAIAGIMGGKDSEVTESTQNIVLEAAVFNSKRVRKGSRSIGLTSEASKRFERGVDSNFTYKALLKAIELIENLASKDNKKLKIGKIQKAGEPLKKEIKIKLSSCEIHRVLGITLKAKEIADLLNLLEFKTNLLQNEQIEVTVPLSRMGDITRSIDLVEEVARLYGYDQVPALPPRSTISAKNLTTSNEIRRIKSHFLSCGFSECYLTSLIGEQVLNKKDFPFDHLSSITMLNPLSKEHSTLRQCLLAGLLEALKLNQHHQIQHIKLFEIGKTYFSPKNNTTSESEKETSVLEKLKLAGAMTGFSENWLRKESSQEQLFFNAKGILESFFAINKLEVNFIKSKEDFLHPNFTLKINVNDEDIGIIGLLHPQTEKRLEIIGPVIVFEINLEPIINHLIKVKTNQKYEKISSTPIVERDITIDLSKKYEASLVTLEIKKVISDFVTNLLLISVYELDNENRSLTYRLKMHHYEQTLTTSHIENEVDKIKKHLSSCFQAKFRV